MRGARCRLNGARLDGTRVIHRSAGPRFSDLWAVPRDVAVTALDELADAFLCNRPHCENMALAELTQRLRRGDVVLRELPRDQTVVASYRGPCCVYADDAVRTRTRGGCHAARLDESFSEWAQSGLVTARG